MSIKPCTLLYRWMKREIKRKERASAFSNDTLGETEHSDCFSESETADSALGPLQLQSIKNTSTLHAPSEK